MARDLMYIRENRGIFYPKGDFSKRFHPSEVAGSIVNTTRFLLCTALALPTACAVLVAWEVFVRRYTMGDCLIWNC